MRKRGRQTMRFEDRFWPKVWKTDACWIWIAGRFPNGYGNMKYGGEMYAHRVAYIELVGPIPEGLVLDHLCHNPSCVNPAHLEPVTQRENLLRGASTLAARNVAKTHCARGHEYDESNTYYVQSRGRPARRCRTCYREAHPNGRAA